MESVMQPLPSHLDGANVVCFVVLNDSHHQRETPPPEWLDRQILKSGSTGPTADTPLFIFHYVDGEPMKPPAALAICQYDSESDQSAYLFYCNADWEVVQDDLFSTVEEALQQACVQYERLQHEDWQWMK
jgi:hypothetical protein